MLLTAVTKPITVERVELSRALARVTDACDG